MNAFLNRPVVNYEESLLLKNFSYLLPEKNINKKNIMTKCLEQTPQDVDLWKMWFKQFDHENTREIRYRHILDTGYIDGEIFNNIQLTNNDQDYLIHMILLCNSSKNQEVAIFLLEQIQNEDIKLLLSKYINNKEIRNIIDGIPWWGF